MIAHQDPVGDWERGAMGGQDFWGRADELLDKKRKREIDGESGFSDGARDACSQPAGMLSSEGREGPPSVQNLSVSGPVLTNSKSMHFPRQQGHTFENTKDCSDRNRVTRLKMSRITVRWTPPNAIEPGTVKVLSKAKRFTESWKTTLGSYWKETFADPVTASPNWNNCKHAVARSKEPCLPSSWVFFEKTKGDHDTRRIHFEPGSSPSH
ncbi:hypothetical protein B0H14DRAFT_2565001 [Mycena olivaceomarginata]|nr:hypothetical protein B0H14DRAFT_2582875 [Mycena olivaceomarginata]KAJ7883209.1 hypothetical protein B0H14DRAFT_2565001 [Mycena olivaceomarginata]